MKKHTDKISTSGALNRVIGKMYKQAEKQILHTEFSVIYWSLYTSVKEPMYHTMIMVRNDV